MSKKILAAFLAVCMIVGMMAVPVSAATAFPDVAEDHWAASAIERWAGYGVFNGDSDGNFTPEKQMTRAEFAQMLVNLLGLTKESEGTFADVPEDAWYAKVISIALAAGIMTGDNGNARPNDFVSFNEAVVMMARAFGLKPAADAEDQFPDSASWAKDALNAMAAMGAISASEDDQINPAMSFDRAAVAAVADKVIAEYVYEDREEPISGEINGVILVVNNAKVEIKDATVTAPIVVESASVTLTGTTAADVVVGGKDASITADEESSVANVTVGGEAPVVDVKGEIASVTIAEGATEAKIDAPNVPEDAIVNNSTEEATVNGEAVEGKPEEPAPDEGDGEEESNAPGTVQGSGNTTVTKPVESITTPAASTGTIAPPEEGTACTAKTPAEEHNWGTANVTKAATCSETGTAVYTCTKCGATSTVTIGTGSHVFERYTYTATGHTLLCKYCDEQSGDADVAHTKGSFEDKVSASHTWVCVCGYKSREAHTWGDWADASSQAGVAEGKVKQERTCSVCSMKVEQVINKPAAVDPENCEKKNGHEALHDGVSCDGCTYVGEAAHQTAAQISTWTKATTGDAYQKVCTCGEVITTCNHTTKSYTHNTGAQTHTIACTGDCKQTLDTAAACNKVDDAEGDSEATCSQAAVTGSKKCSLCNEKYAGTATGSPANRDYSVSATRPDPDNDGQTINVTECKWCHKTADEVAAAG